MIRFTEEESGSNMGTVPAINQGTEVARPPKVLVPLIKEDLANGKDAAERAGLPYYRAAGEKLEEAQPQVRAQGERWEAWVKRNFGIGLTQARTYMALASATANGKKLGVPSFSSLREFARETGRDSRPTGGAVRRPWTADVDDLAERARKEMERIREEHLTRQQEREADRKLALRLIDIGFKVLAKELHPDKGGSKDAQQRLMRVREHLKMHA